MATIDPSENIWVLKVMRLVFDRGSSDVGARTILSHTVSVVWEDVMISGFGKFCIKEKKKRRGRNPSTGNDITLGARRVVMFRCSSVLKEKLNGKKKEYYF